MSDSANPSSAALSGALFALTGFALFSTHDVIIKYLGAVYSPFQIVFFSALLGFPLVTILLMSDRTEGHLRPRHPWWLSLRVVSSLGTAICAFYAFSVLPLAQVYAMIFATPLLITLLAIPVLGERVGAHRIGAVFVGLLGVIVVLRPGSAELSLGHIAGLGTALGGAVNSIVMRRIGQDERPVVLMLYPMFATVVIMGALTPIYYQPVPLLHLLGFAVIAVLAFAAMLALIAAYRRAEAVVVAPMQYSQILWALLFGLVFFDEIPDRITAIGAAIIIASGVYILLRESGSATSRTRPVLHTRSRAGAVTGLRVSPMLRRAKADD